MCTAACARCATRSSLSYWSKQGVTDMRNQKELFQDLRALGSVSAPAHLLEAVLDELDLGDRFAALETPLGPVFVAWNRLGVSAVMKTATAEEFEARFRA